MNFENDRIIPNSQTDTSIISTEVLRKHKVKALSEDQKSTNCMICNPKLSSGIRQSERKIRSDFVHTPQTVLATAAARFKGKALFSQSDISDVLWYVNKYFANRTHLARHFRLMPPVNHPIVFDENEFLYFLYKNSPDREHKVAPSSTICPVLRHRVERFYQCGWNEACREKGWLPYSEFRSWDVEKIKMKLRAHSKDGTTAPLVNNDELRSLACAVRDIFGTWERGIEVMGFTTNPQGRSRTADVENRQRQRSFQRFKPFRVPVSIRISAPKLF